MRRSIKTQEQDTGLWLVYEERGGQRLIGAIHDKGAKIAGLGCQGYDLYDNWRGCEPGNKIGEARHFSTARSMLRQRDEALRSGAPWPEPIPPMQSSTIYRKEAIRIEAAKRKPDVSKLLSRRCRYWIAGLAVHHSDEPRLFPTQEITEPFIIEPLPMNDRPVIKAALDSWFPQWRVYQGDSSSHEDNQWIWRFPNDLGLSVLVRKREDAVYAAMLKFYPIEETSVALHGPSQLKFKVVKLPGFTRDEYVDYWNDLGSLQGEVEQGTLLEFFIRIQMADGRSWEPDPFWDEHNRRCLGRPQIRALFQNIIQAGPYWLGGYDCWLASCYSIRYPEDLHGFMPVAAWSEMGTVNGEKQCQQWLVLTKDDKFFVDYRAGNTGIRDWGVTPVPVDQTTYPSHIFDWIFKTLIPKLQSHEQA